MSDHLEQAKRSLKAHLEGQGGRGAISPGMIDAIMQAILTIVQAFAHPQPTPQNQAGAPTNPQPNQGS